MTNKSQNTKIRKLQNIESTESEHNEFNKRTLHLNVIACASLKSEEFDIQEAEQESQIGLKALNARGGLQEMLAAQMLSIHQLQQISMGYANRTAQIHNKQYFTNVAIKLANTFVHQANLLNKLQVGSQQKITVEHVEVHNGGQAVVGNINGDTCPDRGKK